MNKQEIQETLRQGECHFVFRKANGDLREAVGTLHPDYLPPVDPDAPAGSNNETEDVVTYWDIESGGWRRFIISNLEGDVEFVG